MDFLTWKLLTHQRQCNSGSSQNHGEEAAPLASQGCHVILGVMLTSLSVILSYAYPLVNIAGLHLATADSTTCT
jgi:hypothetical protein